MIDDNQTEDESIDHEQEELLAKIKQCKKEADRHLAQWREDARECFSFVAGEQWSTEDKARLEEMLRAPVVFNRIGPMIDSVAGSEVNNRQDIQYIPRQVGDSGANEVLTGAVRYVRQNCDAEDEESDAFRDSIICGVGVVETLLDYTDSPEGQILQERRDPLCMRWDPSAKKRNLSDRRWHQREDWLTRDEIEEKWPDSEGKINASQDWGGNDEEGVQHDQTLAWLYKKDATGYDGKTGRFRVVHHQWYELENYHVVLDPMTNQLAEFSEDDFERLQTRLSKLNIPFQSVRKQRKVYKQAFVCGDVVLEESNCPGNRFTYNFITAKRDRNKNVWYGIVRAMIDPQKWANKFFSQILHIVNTNAKGGLMVEESATDNMQRLKDDWSKADSVIELNDGAISQGKIMPKPVSAAPPDVNNMLTFSISSLRDVTGINLELLGMQDRAQAGVLEAQRKQSAMTVLASLFDALRLYRKETGRLLATLVRDYMSDGRLVRIVGGDGTEQYIPLMKEATSLEYDVIVDEASTSPNNKERVFAMLMQLLPSLSQMGVPFGPQLMEYLPLPTAMVAKWQEMMNQQAQQPKQPSPQEIQAQANLIKAQSGAQKDQADAQLAMAEIPVKQQELQVRQLEAQVDQLKAMVEGMIAQLQMAQLNAAAVPQIGTGAPFMAPNFQTQ